jgi:putative FmdB family regulatory protein
MPIFEYHCNDCDTKFETLVMGSSAEPENCDCGSGAIEKVYSSFAAKTGGSASDACATPAECRTDIGGCTGGMCGMN